MTSADVVVIGGGLAGLSCARDLAAAGTDVVVLEARDRAGGRVEQQRLADGRIVQLGGEVVGPAHTSYLALIAELGLTVEPAFAALPGAGTWVFADSVQVGDEYPWFSAADHRAYAVVEQAFGSLVATLDPDNPWAHPEAERLDRWSVGAFLREMGATPAVVAAREMAMLALGAQSVERTSLLSDLRKEAAVGSREFYSYDTWECLRVAEGSATVAQKLAEGLGFRVRLGAPVRSVRAGQVCLTQLASGEMISSDSVVFALPVGPLRDLRLDGISATRLRSLARQRHAFAAKAVFVYPEPFWSADGKDGSAYFETELLGGTWAQQPGVLSALVPPERIGAFDATAPELIERDLTTEMGRAFGPLATEPSQVFLRSWHRDPWTQGYITAWHPGDVLAVGPLHGTHTPPLYFCGSDQWVCGYLEGAVRTGRQTAAVLLAG